MASSRWLDLHLQNFFFTHLIFDCSKDDGFRKNGVNNILMLVHTEVLIRLQDHFLTFTRSHHLLFCYFILSDRILKFIFQ